MFRDRDDAGRELARILGDLLSEHPVVLALPRGGVPVAVVVADALDAELDVIVVRKIGVPGQPEFALGALGEDGVRIVDDALVNRLGVSAGALEMVERAEHEAIQRRQRSVRAVVPAVQIRGRPVVIVDDGLATGATARAACRVARARGAARVVVAVPCAPAEVTADDLDADELRVVEVSSAFGAVGQFYANFAAVSDEAMLRILVESRRAR